MDYFRFTSVAARWRSLSAGLSAIQNWLTPAIRRLTKQKWYDPEFGVPFIESELGIGDREDLGEGKTWTRSLGSEVNNMKLRIFSLTALLTTTYLTTPAKAENIQHTKQLLSTKECQRCDLSNAGLVSAELSGSKLSGANLSRANLSRANLMGADLSGANLSGASLYGANLSGANLKGANLSGTDLRSSYLTNATLVGVDLKSAFIDGALGIPDKAGTPEDFYNWAIAEAEHGNYRGAIDYFNQALVLKPEFAGAYLGRGLSRYRLGDERGATLDAQTSAQLFTAQGSSKGFQTAQNFIKGMEDARKPPGKSGGSDLLNFLGSAAAILLQVLTAL